MVAKTWSGPSALTFRREPRSHYVKTATKVEAAGRFNPALHPHDPGTGRFRNTLDRILDGLRRWADAGGKGDPFEGFEREPLRRTAVARGITLRRGASREEISKALLANLRDALGGDGHDREHAPAKKAAKKADLEGQAVDRQRELDELRPVVSALTDVDELLASNASDRALRHRIEHHPGTPDALRRQLLDAAGDRIRLRALVNDTARDHHLTPVETAGAAVRFDRERHETLGPPIEDGAPALVVRQGYIYDRPGEGPVHFARAKVLASDEAEYARLTGTPAPTGAALPDWLRDVTPASPSASAKVAKKAAPAASPRLRSGPTPAGPRLSPAKTAVSPAAPRPRAGRTTEPNASEVRQQLLATPRADRHAYLEGLGLNQAQTRRLARGLGVRGQDRSTAPDIRGRIVSHFEDAGGEDTAAPSPRTPAPAQIDTLVDLAQGRPANTVVATATGTEPTLGGSIAFEAYSTEEDGAVFLRATYPDGGGVGTTVRRGEAAQWPFERVTWQPQSPTGRRRSRNDGLAAMSDTDLYDLAMEYTIPPVGLGTADRQALIDRLRAAGAVAPASTVQPSRRPTPALRVSLLLNDWSAGNGPDDPLATGFTREQLRAAARERNITLRRGASEAAIRRALYDSVVGSTRARRAAAGNLTPTGDLFAIRDDAELTRRAKEVFEGDFGGLTTVLDNAYFNYGGRSDLSVRGRILDANGHQVGTFSRNISRGANGDITVYHAYLQISGSVQGNGFSNAFNGHLISWYRRSGVREVTVSANIDVGGYCVPERARVLTRAGWKKHDAIVDGDETLGYDFATGTLRWTPILGVARFESLPMWRLEHRNWAVECTPNHRWVASRFAAPDRKATWLAPEMLTTDRVVKHGRRIVVSAPVEAPDTSGLTVDEAALLGWLVTDGNVTRRTRTGRSMPEVTASIAQEKPAGRSALEALGYRLGWSLTPRGCNVPAQALRALYAKLGVVYGEPLRPHLESAVLRMGQPQLAAFADAGMLAEGDHDRARFWQKPGAVLDAFTLAFFLLGHRVAVSTDAGGLGWASVSQGHVTSERIRVTDLGTTPAWCPQTGLGTWVMELDGHVMVTGNTWASFGYDFADRHTADDMLARFKNAERALTADRYHGRQPRGRGMNTSEQIAALRTLIARADASSFGRPGYPSAYEFSQAGRWDGAGGRRDVWIGKALMLGTSWHGRLDLTTPSPSGP